MIYKAKTLPGRLSHPSIANGVSNITFDHTVVACQAQLHWHSHYEMEFVVRGEGSQTMNGKPVPLAPGTLYLSTPADFHEITAAAGYRLEMVSFGFSEEVITDELRELIFNCTGPLAVTFTGADHDWALLAVNRLERELRRRSLGVDTMSRALIYELLIELVRSCRGEEDEERRHYAINPVQSSLVYIHHHFKEPLTLEQVARVSHLSPNYYSECFHRETGRSFRSYLQHVRLQFAAALLAGSEIPVTEICFASGFGSVSQFGRAFKQCFEVSPVGYRYKALTT